MSMKFKEFVCLILVLACSLTILSGCGNQSRATGAVPTFGIDSNFEVRMIAKGKCEITSCTATSDIIYVPNALYDRPVAGIGNFAFENSKASKIVLPDTVEYIGLSAFKNCENLKTVEFGNGLERIGRTAFVICPSLEKIIFPDSLMTIEGHVFSMCPVLSEVYIPETTKDIPQGITYLELCPNITVKTPKGSVAETRAIERGIPVVYP